MIMISKSLITQRNIPIPLGYFREGPEPLSGILPRFRTLHTEKFRAAESLSLLTTPGAVRACLFPLFPSCFPGAGLHKKVNDKN